MTLVSAEMRPWSKDISKEAPMKDLIVLRDERRNLTFHVVVTSYSPQRDKGYLSMATDGSTRSHRLY